MAREQLATARELIKQKRYDEARALLRTINDPVATQWLDKLEQMAPESSLANSATISPKITNTNNTSTQKSNSGGNVITTLVLVALVGIILLVVVYGTFLRSAPPDLSGRIAKIETNLGQANSFLSTLSAPTLTPRPTLTPYPTLELTPTPQATQAVRTWTFLTMQYSQLTDIGSVPGFSNGYSEAGAVSDPQFNHIFDDANACSALTDKSSCKKNSKGLAYYLNLLGNDGWQIVTLNDKSSQYVYSVEIILEKQN